MKKSKFKQSDVDRHKHTLVHYGNVGIDKTIVWIEGADLKLKIRPEPFGQVGGGIDTNTGAMFTKKFLAQLLAIMPDHAVLKVAGCNNLKSRKEVEADFAEENAKVYLGDGCYALTE